MALGRFRYHWPSEPSVAQSSPSEEKRPTSIGDRTSGRKGGAAGGGVGARATDGSRPAAGGSAGVGTAAAIFSVVSSGDRSGNADADPVEAVVVDSVGDGSL